MLPNATEATLRRGSSLFMSVFDYLWRVVCVCVCGLAPSTCNRRDRPSRSVWAPPPLVHSKMHQVPRRRCFKTYIVTPCTLASVQKFKACRGNFGLFMGFDRLAWEEARRLWNFWPLHKISGHLLWYSQAARVCGGRAVGPGPFPRKLWAGMPVGGNKSLISDSTKKAGPGKTFSSSFRQRYSLTKIIRTVMASPVEPSRGSQNLPFALSRQE